METVSELLGADHDSLAVLLHDLQSELRQRQATSSFRLLDLFWARLAVHIRAENLCLFPKLLNAPRDLFSKGGGVPSFERVSATIADLRTDHNFFMDELAGAIKTMRGFSEDPESTLRVAHHLEAIHERIVALSVRLDSHNVLEEEHVYMWPNLILGSSDLESLVNNMKHQLENLPPRFANPSLP